MKEGDIISLEYEGWADGKLFDTTSEAVAREHDLHDEQRLYQPLVVIVGGGRLVAGLEEHLQEAEVSQEYEVTIPAEKAYGQRDPRLIQMHSAAEFRRLKLEAYPGAEVEINGRHGHVSLMAGSRIRVDYNHHLAGQDLTFKYTIVSRIEGDLERVRALFAMEYPEDPEVEIELDGKQATLKLPDRCKFDPAWFQAKYRVVAALRKQTDITDIIFLEHYAGTPAEEAEAEGAEAEEAKAGADEAQAQAQAEAGEAEETESGDDGTIVEANAAETVADAAEAGADEAEADEAGETEASEADSD